MPSVRDHLTALDGHDHDPHDAHAYRLMQAEHLLRQMGYVPQDNGTWTVHDEVNPRIGRGVASPREQGPGRHSPPAGDVPPRA
jgi:hypothetical protein